MPDVTPTARGAGGLIGLTMKPIANREIHVPRNAPPNDAVIAPVMIAMKTRSHVPLSSAVMPACRPIPDRPRTEKPAIHAPVPAMRSGSVRWVLPTAKPTPGPKRRRYRHHRSIATAP